MLNALLGYVKAFKWYCLSLDCCRQTVTSMDRGGHVSHAAKTLIDITTSCKPKGLNLSLDQSLAFFPQVGYFCSAHSGMESAHARVSLRASSAKEAGFETISRPASLQNTATMALREVAPLKARVNIGDIRPESVPSTSELDQLNLMQKAHQRLRNVSSHSSLHGSPPTTTLSPPAVVHARPNVRTTNATARRKVHEVQAKTETVQRARGMDTALGASEPSKPQTSLLPSARISGPSSTQFVGTHKNYDTVIRPARSHVNHRNGMPVSSTSQTIRSTVPAASHRSAPHHVSLHHNQNEYKMKHSSPTASPTREKRQVNHSSPTRASLARAGLLQNAEISASPSPSRTFPVLRARTAPNIPISSGDVSNSWVDCTSQSTQELASPMSNNQVLASVPPLSSTPADLSMEMSDISDAKQARKLLDLEISNKSLLAVNSALESSKVKLTKELRELRQNMILHKSVSSPLSDGEEQKECARQSLAKILHPRSNSNQKANVCVEALHVFMQLDHELEAIQERCCLKIDNLLEEARAAILAKPDADSLGSGKVLHPSEMDCMVGTSTSTNASENANKGRK